MGKEGTTLYLDPEKIERVRELGYVPSRIVDATLDIILSEEFEDLNVQIKLKMIDDTLAEDERLIGVCEAKKAALIHDVEYLRAHRKMILTEWETTKTLVRQTQLLNSLNRIIIAAEFDFDLTLTSGREYVEQLTKLNPHFDLAKQIEKLKILVRQS